MTAPNTPNPIPASPSAVSGGDGALRKAAKFLAERLGDFGNEIEDDQVSREYWGHVAPALARLVSALAAQSPTSQTPRADLLPIWREGGLGHRLLKAVSDYRKEYIYSTDEVEHVPTEWEAVLLEDFVAGAFADEVNVILQEAALDAQSPASPEPVADDDADLTAAYMVGFERGKNAAKALATPMPSQEDRLREALSKYGQHKSGCNVARALPFERRSGVVKCTCGFEAALSTAAKEGGSDA